MIKPLQSSSFRTRTLVAVGLVMIVGALLIYRFEARHPGETDLPEFPMDDIAARKEAFFDFLRPVVRHHNDRIRDERTFLMSLDENSELDRRQRHRLDALAERYDVNTDSLDQREVLRLLRLRVDVVPAALVLVQAAKESGWGRSRFAREGNALFGEWCFSEGCGIVPARRSPGRLHEVRSFDTVHDSVASYMDNINSHKSYRGLRLARAELRDQGEKLSGLALVAHLSQYSERGAIYTEEVRRMIKMNGLESE